MRRQIGVNAGELLFCDPFALLLEFLQDAGQRPTLWKIKQLATTMVVLDDLALLMTAVLGNDAFAAEECPFEKAVELTAPAMSGGGPIRIPSVPWFLGKRVIN